MIKAAIFDVDGTLLDSMGIWMDIGARYLKSIQVEPEENLTEILYPMSMKEGAAYIRDHYQIARSVPEIIQGVIGIVKGFYEKEVPLKAGIREFLEELRIRGIPMAVATASGSEYIEAAFCRLGIRGYFKRIFTCEEVGAGKTEALIYQMAAQYLGEKPSDICVFEDVLHAVMTAKNAGFRVAGVYDKYSTETEEIKRISDIYLPDFMDFKTFWDFWK